MLNAALQQVKVHRCTNSAMYPRFMCIIPASNSSRTQFLHARCRSSSRQEKPGQNTSTVTPQTEEQQDPVLKSDFQEKVSIWWPAATQSLMNFATLALVVDTARQLMSTAAAAAAAEPVLTGTTTFSWVSSLSPIVSFFILSSTFVDDGEIEGILCYVGGLVACYLLFAQDFFLSNAAPLGVFTIVSSFVALSLTYNIAKCFNVLNDSAWQRWRDVTGCIGFALLPQIVGITLMMPIANSAGGVHDAISAEISWAPAVLSGLLGIVLLQLCDRGVLPRSCREVWDVASWCATLLFMNEPLAALTAYARDPGLLAIPEAAFFLPALATGLQVPRALLKNSHMWFTGTSFATIFAAIQAAIIAASAGRSWTAILILLLTCSFFGAIFTLNAISRRLPTPWHSLLPILAVYREQMSPFNDIKTLAKTKLKNRLTFLVHTHNDK